MKFFTLQHKYFCTYLPFIAFFIFFCTFNCAAQTVPVLSFNPLITTGFSSPVEIAHAGDGSNRLFIVQQGGTIRIISGGVLQPGNFLNIFDSLSTGGERGLLSMAFHPNYKVNRYFFVYYTNRSGDVTIARFRTSDTNPDMAEAASGVVLMKIPKPYANHNGGHLNFGPDGKLYFGTGDGGSGGDPNNFSQNGNSLLGKMIRIDVDDFSTPPYYTIPADNPYVNDPNIRDEIFAIGLRNPFRWSFDRLNNDIWIGDVGQGLWEEVDHLPFAKADSANYGWRCYEGNHAYNTTGCLPQTNYVSPIFEYTHNATTGGYSITGGFVYRGASYPAMYGYYFCADYVSGNVWLINPSDSGGFRSNIQRGLPGSIVAFGEAENGELYALGLNGKLYSITTITPVADVLLTFTASSYSSFNQLNWSVGSSQHITSFEVQYSPDAIQFQSVATVLANGNSRFAFSHIFPDFTLLYYRIKIISDNGAISYSTTLPLRKEQKGDVKIYPTLVNNQLITIETVQSFSTLLLYAADGKRVFNKTLTGNPGIFQVQFPFLSRGVYWLQLLGKDGKYSQKIIIQ